MSSILICLALASPPADAEVLQEAEAAFAEGLRHREAGQRGAAAFGRAAAAYEELRRRGAENPDLYRNLGNAHLLAGDLPRAILAYRLGLQLAPTDETLLASLAAAREQVVFADGTALGRPPEERGPLRPLLTDWLFTLAALTYAAACAVLTRWWMLRQGRLLVAAVLLLVVAGACAVGVAVRSWPGSPRPVVVIARDGVLLRKGNGWAFPPWHQTPLNRGVEAEVVYESDGWLQVELSGGEVGWVSAVEVVR